ncbi:MAG: hypothetical protein AW08_03783 [Candidatus Accumulibacter adjunctus]|uniref:Uncharacterized protein n=1 Tax=Candidatus Accumulibacter adjunctus TaxID=1454001 RepID=A0A011M3K7_9PROT|nr:MAG: hypothetical protein AW08_03783 [Candidatus Accumulibacter adjunctus]
MPRIFDNIDKALLPALQRTMEVTERADFCVGYFNLRGWRHLSGYVDRWAGGAGQCCRLLIGMHVSPSDGLHRALRARDEGEALDNQTAIREKRQVAEDFRDQLTFGVPTNADEAGLHQLSRQPRSGKLVVKVHLRHPLHAKLYLLFRRTRSIRLLAVLGAAT